MKLRYVSLGESRTEVVADACPNCRANLLAPDALRCRVLTDIVHDQVTPHEDGQPDELQWDNMAGNFLGDLREPMQWRCAACDALVCPTRRARPANRWAIAPPADWHLGRASVRRRTWSAVSVIGLVSAFCTTAPAC